jgi:hypothetical protein
VVFREAIDLLGQPRREVIVAAFAKSWQSVGHAGAGLL